ncbi:SH3 domain-containing protein [Exilibacterium tricleocarpae]|uniref:SH3 domain-containing protein n=1 Tax=Exilibacterium tricleocarpae TaxID=2591008 RepID=A0A545TAG7_9GAMM|nr:SH3 domain-containing protein [Exilibacterium tricleocarpae]TQV74206.1 SH3 domain-containing protein [Exilibacterium tricleocarpae]
MRFMKMTGALLAAWACQIDLVAAGAPDQSPLQLEVIDPFVEMHTGPGRGYPVFYTVEQGETIQVITRRTGWYEISTADGRKGWARADQVARTLLPTGEPVDLPSVSYGDYLKNSWRAGFNAGQLSSDEIKGMDTFSFTLGYRPLSWLGVEVESGKLYDNEIRGDYYNLNVLVEPFSHWKLSPALVVGGGSIEIESQPELTPLEFEDESFYSLGLSVNYYIGRNFVVRTGYQSYTISGEDDDERLDRWNLGFNAFF